MNTMVIEPTEKAEACVIWMHGLGAGAEDMSSLAQQLPLNRPVRHVALNAPVRPVTINQGMVMPAWYDITGFSLTDREDKAGILDSENLIRTEIKAQIASGLSSEAIYLAGFSQGGAMALFTALRTAIPLGGVVALSAYLPLAAECEVALDLKTPFFIASGELDSIVLPAWTTKTVAHLREAGLNALTVRSYAMEHAVCLEEVQDLVVWFKQQQIATTVAGGGV